MKETELNAKIKTAFTHATPDVLDAVLSDSQTQKGQVIALRETGTRKKGWRTIAGLAACLVLVLGGVFGLNAYQSGRAVAATVSLDVNPSLQITVNQKERVLAVTPLNDDARAVIGDMDLAGSDLEVAVNALIGSMLRGGYLSDAANSILITVDGQDAAKGAELQARLSRKVDALLQADGLTGAVLSQTLTDSEALTQTAERYGITRGKAQLIQEILDAGSAHTFEELAPLTINELNLLLSDLAAPRNVTQVGAASDKAYIGMEKAKELALAHAGLAASDVTRWETDLDVEQGVWVYELGFLAGGHEYEYDINATDGQIISSRREADDDAPMPPADGVTAPAGAIIGEDAAKAAALTHAGVEAGSAVWLRCKLDSDDGAARYELEFHDGACEYDYEIDAATGAVHSHSREVLPQQIHHEEDHANPHHAASAPTFITADDATSAALRHAGLSAADVSALQCELDSDDGVARYEMEFQSGGYTYEYEIDALTGAILNHEKELDD